MNGLIGDRYRVRRLAPACALALSIVCVSAAPARGEPAAAGGDRARATSSEDAYQGDFIDRKRPPHEHDDEERPDVQLSVPIFGRPLTIGGEYETKLETEVDHDLDGETQGDRSRLRQNVELELFYPASEGLSLFVEGEYRYRWEVRRGEGDLRSDGDLKRGEMWIHLTELGGSGFSLQLGRQKLRDRREWWWDEKLDAVRALYEGGQLEAELTFAEELAPSSFDEDFIDPEVEDVRRVLGAARWRYTGKHYLELFALYHDDHSDTENVGEIVDEDREDEIDADLAWVGLRARGRWPLAAYGGIDYWLDGAVVEGEETRIDFDDAGDGRSVSEAVVSRDVRGWAVDTGFTLAPKRSWRPSLTLGYAVGSGDRDPVRGRDRAFRQTGLHSNDVKLAGVSRLRYYGELVDPELSNLQIATAGLGFRFLRSSSFDLLYRYYRQVHAADFLRDADLDADPEGEDPSIGHGADAVLALEEWRHLRIELVGSVFRADEAFGERIGEMAYGASGKVELAF